MNYLCVNINHNAVSWNVYNILQSTNSVYFENLCLAPHPSVFDTHVRIHETSVFCVCVCVCAHAFACVHKHEYIYCISWHIRRTFSLKKCDLNSTCVLCAECKYYFQIYKYPFIYYTTSLLWDSEIRLQIMRSGITVCERLTFLSGSLPQHIHCITCDSRYLRCCSSKV
jgi:hypothetical protein